MKMNTQEVKVFDLYKEVEGRYDHIHCPLCGCDPMDSEDGVFMDYPLNAFAKQIGSQMLMGVSKVLICGHCHDQAMADMLAAYEDGQKDTCYNVYCNFDHPPVSQSGFCVGCAETLAWNMKAGIDRDYEQKKARELRRAEKQAASPCQVPLGDDKQVDDSGSNPEDTSNRANQNQTMEGSTMQAVITQKAINHEDKNTRKPMMVLKATVNKMNQKTRVSALDYSDPSNTGKGTGYDIMYGNEVMDVLNNGTFVVPFKKEGDGIVFINEKEFYDMRHLLYVDLNLKLEKGQKELTGEQKQFLADVIDDGIYVDVEGQKHKYVYFMRSPSQERQVQAVYIRADYNIAEAFKKLNLFPLAYSAFSSETRKYTVDVSKMIKRFGLTLSSSVPVDTIKIGKEIEYLDENNKKKGYYVRGGNITVLVLEEPHAYVQTGKYLVNNFNPETEAERFIELDAKLEPLKQKVIDGVCLHGKNVNILVSESLSIPVESVSDMQIRFSGTKGLTEYVYDLEEYFPGVDMVIFKSALKASWENCIDTLDARFRVCVFNKAVEAVKKFTATNYQYIYTSDITADEVLELAQDAKNKAKKMLEDPKMMQKCVGLARLNHIDLDNMTEEDQAELDSALYSTFLHFLYGAPVSYKDVQMKKFAAELIKKMVKEFKHGSLPIRAHYKFMSQDVYAVLDAFKVAIENPMMESLFRDKKGDFVVPSCFGLKPGEVFVMSENGNVWVDEVGLQRSPAITTEEAVVAQGVAHAKYVEAAKHGSFRNICVMSCHDLNTQKMGGADNDGDKCLVVFDTLFVAVLKRTSHLPSILDVTRKENEDGSVEYVDGCPYEGEEIEVPAIRFSGVEQKGFKITFSQDVAYSDEFIMALHELSKTMVKRTLSMNKIGIMTDYATILADAITKIKYVMQTQTLSKENMERGQAYIKQARHYIRVLRLVQGWEIDRPKHGGAYEQDKTMKAALEFIKNPPVYASFPAPTKKNPNRRKWNQLNWLKSKRGSEGHIAHESVLGLAYKDLAAWEEKFLVEDIKELKKLDNANNLIEEFNCVFSMDYARYTSLRIHIAKIIENYNELIQEVFAKTEELEAEANAKYDGCPELLEMELTDIHRAKMIDIQTIQMGAKQHLAALEKGFSDEEIGYVSYILCYERERTATTFPWKVAGAYLLQLMQLLDLENRKPVLMKKEMPAPTEIRFYCSEDDRNYENAMKYMVTRTGSYEVCYEQGLRTENFNYVVYLTDKAGNKKKLGYIFNDYVSYFYGGTQFTLDVVDASVKGKTAKTFVSAITATA